MSIDPLQALRPAPPTPERVSSSKRTGDSSFGKLLDALQSNDVQPKKTIMQAGAELVRIEMMQSCLSLTDNAEAPRSFSNPDLAALLNALDAKSRSLRAPGPSSALPEDVPPAAPVSGADTDSIEQTAFHFIGTPYRFGGEGPSGIDCSSFVQQVYGEHSIDLPRTAREQSAVGSEVALQDLQKGDLVFFSTYASYPSHVGIYLGDGKMIHASSGKGEVVVSDINSGYYQSRFLGAKRVA